RAPLRAAPPCCAFCAGSALRGAGSTRCASFHGRCATRSTAWSRATAIAGSAAATTAWYRPRSCAAASSPERRVDPGSPMATPPDREKLKEYAKRVVGALGGAMTSAMIYAGDRLGLYRALAGAGALSAAELASRTGLSERWLREWLHQQGAAGVLDYRGDDRFALSAGGGAGAPDRAGAPPGVGVFRHPPPGGARDARP